MQRAITLSLRYQFLVLGLTCLCQPIFAETPEAIRSIVQISGNLYRYQENAHFSVFLVTDDGVIATDPLNATTAHWLKAELAKRFGTSVKYLIYSHHHEDHASGGEVFKDTATIIAHINAVDQLIEDQVPTALPDITFSDELTISLGGETVYLTYAGISHSDNSIIVHFPKERAVYAVDFVLAKALPYRNLPLNAYHYPEWLDALHNLDKMDFDILLAAHDHIGNKGDVRIFRRYLEDLEAAVQTAIDQGLTIDEAKSSVSLPQYATWDKYDDWFGYNVEGMYRQLTEASLAPLP